MIIWIVLILFVVLMSSCVMCLSGSVGIWYFFIRDKHVTPSASKDTPAGEDDNDDGSLGGKSLEISTPAPAAQIIHFEKKAVDTTTTDGYITFAVPQPATGTGTDANNPYMVFGTTQNGVSAYDCSSPDNPYVKPLTHASGPALFMIDASSNTVKFYNTECPDKISKCLRYIEADKKLVIGSCAFTSADVGQRVFVELLKEVVTGGATADFYALKRLSGSTTGEIAKCFSKPGATPTQPSSVTNLIDCIQTDPSGTQVHKNKAEILTMAKK